MLQCAIGAFRPCAWCARSPHDVRLPGRPRRGWLAVVHPLCSCSSRATCSRTSLFLRHGARPRCSPASSGSGPPRARAARSAPGSCGSRLPRAAHGHAAASRGGACGGAAARPESSGRGIGCARWRCWVSGWVTLARGRSATDRAARLRAITTGGAARSSTANNARVWDDPNLRGNAISTPTRNRGDAIPQSLEARGGPDREP